MKFQAGIFANGWTVGQLRRQQDLVLGNPFGIDLLNFGQIYLDDSQFDWYIM
jgi:hypothetical protein